MNHIQKPEDIHGTRIIHCGIQQCTSQYFYGPAIRNKYVLHFILSGKGSYKVNEEIFQLHSGCAFLIRPGETTFYQADKDLPWEYAWITFDGIEACSMMNSFPHFYIFDFEEIDFVRRYFMEFIERFNYNNQLNQREWRGYFHLLTSKLVKHEPNMISYNEYYYNMAIEYIKNNYDFRIQISDICNYIGIERTHLFRIFKLYAKQSPKEYLTNYRLSLAKNMLLTTSYSTTEIALSCGFHDSSNFCKCFQKYNGMTPLQFKKETLSI